MKSHTYTLAILLYLPTYTLYFPSRCFPQLDTSYTSKPQFLL
ncbi:hypothetical protein [Pontibacter mucosus]|nr:hypothetical protein [Pontibacter mucosus]